MQSSSVLPSAGPSGPGTFETRDVHPVDAVLGDDHVDQLSFPWSQISAVICPMSALPSSLLLASAASLVRSLVRGVLSGIPTNGDSKVSLLEMNLVTKIHIR